MVDRMMKKHYIKVDREDLPSRPNLIYIERGQTLPHPVKVINGQIGCQDKVSVCFTRMNEVIKRVSVNRLFKLKDN